MTYDKGSQGQRGVHVVHPRDYKETPMRRARRIMAVVIFVYCVRLSAQSPAPAGASSRNPVQTGRPAGGVASAAPANTSQALSVPPGESLVLELKSPLNSKSARKGD